MATLKNTIINGNAYLKLPTGTTAQRPTSASNGMVRFNTDTREMEHYENGRWIETRTGRGGIVTQGLRSYWDADVAASAPTGGNGTTWVDISDHPNKIGNVNIQGRNSDWSYSTVGGVGVVTNGTQRSGAGFGIPYPTTNFNKLQGTWEFWCRPTSWSNGSHGLIVNRDNDTANDGNWFWSGSWSSGGTWYFRHGTTSSCCNMDLTTGTGNLASLNTWSLVAMTWDWRGNNNGQSSGSKYLYKNGVQVTRSDNTENTVNNSHTSSTGLFGVGHSTTNSQWLGQFGAIRHYDRPLEAQELYQNFVADKKRYGI